METIQSVEVVLPEWARGRSLDEQTFCQEFLMVYPFVYVDGQFYSYKGRMDEDLVRKYVFEYLSCYVHTGLSKKVSAIMDVLKMMARKDELPLSETKIFCANGTYDLSTGKLSSRMDLCRFRLPVNYNPDAPEPVLWKSFLEELLEPEDILTLQEYLGYCLIPVNYAQKMMLIIGSGGEGKSRIGVVMHHLMGKTMCNGSLAKVESSPFARADLQHRLLMVDDDLRLEALNSTNYIKSIVTTEQEMDLERKGQQSYQGLLRCRFLAFGNGNLRSLHDRSIGFFRRQIVLSAKPRRSDRQDDPYLGQKLRRELEGILLWCIEGLQRLVQQDLKFTLSRKTRENILAAMAEGNNTLEFMRSSGYIRKDPEGEITSRLLYEIYKDWCADNALPPLAAKSFISSILQNVHLYGITYSNNISGGNGRMVRGFRGIRRDSRF